MHIFPNSMLYSEGGVVEELWDSYTQVRGTLQWLRLLELSMVLQMPCATSWKCTQALTVPLKSNTSQSYPPSHPCCGVPVQEQSAAAQALSSNPVCSLFPGFCHSLVVCLHARLPCMRKILKPKDGACSRMGHWQGNSSFPAFLLPVQAVQAQTIVLG